MGKIPHRLLSAAALGLGALALSAALWLLVVFQVKEPLVRETLGLQTRLDAMDAKVADLEKLLEEARAENSGLRSQVEGNMLTLQDVYFEQLKKNDGLQGVWTDPRPGRRAYLTFDDGPTANTALILDALKAAKVQASFFVNGRPEGAALCRRIVKEGHRLGNHTWSHDYAKIYASVTAFVDDTEKLEAWMAAQGLAPTKSYRFPGGAKNEIAARLAGPDLTGKISAALADRGYRFFEWNVAVGDGESGPDNVQLSSKEIRKAVASQVRNKRIAVILLHDGPGHGTTAKAVPGIIADLKKAGFTLEALP